MHRSVRAPLRYGGQLLTRRSGPCCNTTIYLENLRGEQYPLSTTDVTLSPQNKLMTDTEFELVCLIVSWKDC
ncbi:uncharacterized protein PHALS_06104 [Plasmopara halstedii]|uniref:Uncharacterized protein n=1 Tax=Plasmopara halstedii TaxID=4781 RepID=A0A0P1B211_PLAHL|nr:uncharacterized protein PHALS_06104 [Plasmopara halstedii]CEG48274.1 hypothetical protein PHALS_06104 [Plasmopara halstedii]|eukprot:XP_024584643.1 hypothetical protein PHALS_06104 [Plasmopara halstedii]